MADKKKAQDELEKEAVRASLQRMLQDARDVYEQEAHPVSGRPVLHNRDGSISTEESITVTEPYINGGKPTNIPTIWDGRRLSESEALRRAAAAIRSGKPFPSFDTIDEAVEAAKARSAMLGSTYMPEAPRSITIGRPRMESMRPQGVPNAAPPKGQIREIYDPVNKSIRRVYK